MYKVNLKEKFDLIRDHWNPRLVGELNGQHVRLVKFEGEFVWHKHAEADEMFLVVEGSFEMQFRDHKVTLNKGEFIIVPAGTEHRPFAEKEVQVLLFEPADTINTGDAGGDHTVEQIEKI